MSFRAIKSKRDYLRKGQSASWMYMSRLAAIKEFAFMKVRLSSVLTSRPTRLATPWLTILSS